MSRAVQTTVTLPEIVVRNPSRYGKSLHRLDEDADGVRPAFSEGDYRDVDWNDVQRAAYEGHYGLCDDRECFGRDWR